MPFGAGTAVLSRTLSFWLIRTFERWTAEAVEAGIADVGGVAGRRDATRSARDASSCERLCITQRGKCR
ncbi:hypothetical protein AAW51_3064 [Caldimonas brevitalea]|uniref:Uncharacterized protein n=1 Tax=Caldimonas brevitalea TaxID=413882 RepID=A0A0G3BTA8_9BURK|nr:hypothetical protein AAW51_3064 [Caldimonas brevitalea]